MTHYSSQNKRIAAGDCSDPTTPPSSRYSDQPVDWRTRLAGLGGSAGVLGLICAAALFTWHSVSPATAPNALTVLNISRPAAPPEPVHEVLEGKKQVEQMEQKPKEQDDRLDPPKLIVPAQTTTPAPPPAEPTMPAADPVPQTTAPKSIPAPPANRAASNNDASWEAQLLAHLEKYRRYPSTARARRDQGVAHVRFRMSRQGTLLSVEIQQSSGSAALDRAALETLRRAQPLPSIPADRPDTLELSVPMEFFINAGR